ncbi:hypothetical protein T440DRAFT_518233 [Plenodomus tracheiphilus IPT5]|uniref:Uncharacterized protein n=1 Tax=Plenodomus tracheiphilus IPT5 TaxID=1408161 RepID=A0A6A7B8A6_9PLEO|nr:hypothetical protein T440DRAFT_518233 [Plenodomus tracheiphilus IPT5]
MGVWQWYKGLSPRTRMMVGVGMMAYAGAGLYFGDYIEERYGFKKATEKEREELWEAIPKITVIEKKNR